MSFFKVVNLRLDKQNEESTLSQFSIHNLLNHFENKKNISLLVGQVQSGKTGYMINIARDARNNLDYDYIFVLSGTTTRLCNQTFQRFEKAMGSVYDSRWLDEENIHKTKGSNIILLKNKDVLNKWTNFMKSQCWDKQKILIIDDESDYGSINTGCQSEYSTFSRLIKESYNQIVHGGMILVTATPYSNILNNKNENQISKIWSTEINENYTGLNYFNQQPNFYLTKNFTNNNAEINVYKYLEYSICIWLINTYLLFNSNDINKKSDLLIYCSDKKEKHIEFKNDIDSIIDRIKSKSLDQDDIFKLALADKNVSLDFDCFEEWLKKHFYQNFSNNTTIVLNSDFKERENEDSHLFKIYIGGVLLSRGVTYENLTTELFLYLSEDPTVDTLLQRCRWFGYRKPRVNFMNVIIDSKIDYCLKEAQKYNDIFVKHQGQELDFLEVQNQIKEMTNNNSILKGTSNGKW